MKDALEMKAFQNKVHIASGGGIEGTGFVQGFKILIILVEGEWLLDAFMIICQLITQPDEETVLPFSNVLKKI